MSAVKKIIDHIQAEMKTRMEEINIGPSDLEKKAGLKESVVRNILNGNSKNPGIESLMAIARTLGCSLDELVGKEELQNLSNQKLAPKQKAIVDWDPDLYQDATRQVQSYIHNKSLKLHGEQVLFFIKETYLYSSKTNNTKADSKFIEWLIDSYC
ncbi:MAG: helix-turn-helix domain-containing protein [Rickettsiales bacterium]